MQVALPSKPIASKVVDLAHATLDAIARCVEAREYPEAIAAMSVLTSLVSIDGFRPIIEDAIDDEDAKEDETGVDDNDPLHGAGEVDFLNTKLPRAFSVTNDESAAITIANSTPPEHQRYVGPLLPDGSVPQS